MVSKTDICNRALMEAKYDQTIESLTEHTVASDRCAKIYDACRRECLCKYPWAANTSFREVGLIYVSEETSLKSFIYEYPDDALRILNYYDSEEEYLTNKVSPAKLSSRVLTIGGDKCIMSNNEHLFVEYVVDEDNEENFSPVFTRLFYLEMAVVLAKMSGHDETFLRTLMLQIDQTRQDAMILSISEGDNGLRIEDDSYILARG